MNPCSTCQIPTANCLEFCPQVLHATGSASGWWEEHVIDWTYQLIDQTQSFTNPESYGPLLRWLQTTSWS